METVQDIDFEIVQEYVNTGSSKAISERQQKVLDTCILCYGLMRDFPQRSTCMKKLMSLTKMPRTTAGKFVDFTRKTWGDYLSYKRDFLNTFFLERLMYEITRPGASEMSRAKNLATLQKHIENMPDANIDPHLTEANNVYIQVNLTNNRSFKLPERVLKALPVELRQEIMSAVDDNVDDDGAVKLLES